MPPLLSIQALCESQPGCRYIGWEESDFRASAHHAVWLSEPRHSYPNLYGNCVAADSDQEESVPETGQVGLVDWDNCTWHGFIFDCSTLGEKDPWGNYYTHNPWEACRNIDQDELDQGLHPYGYWVPACDDLYDDPVPSIAQACAATCAEYQYVPLPPISRAPNVSLGVTILDRGWSHQGPGHNAGLHVGRWRVQLLESRTQRSLGRLVVWLEPLGCLQQYPGATCSL